MKNLWPIGLLLWVVACSRSPADKHLEALKTARSWVATAEMTGNFWQKGKIPDRYAGQTLRRSQRQIAGESSTLPDASQSRATVDKMIAAVDRHDRAAIVAPLRELTIERERLDALVRKGGERP